jgi:predicted patatin/cPLA2 family phospholipase
LADGGIAHVAPLSDAIDHKATDIICVVCQAQSEASLAPGFDSKNIMNLISRDMDILTNAMVNNDLRMIQKIKTLMQGAKTPEVADAFAAYQAATVRIIRPDTAIGVDILSFTSADIKSMIEAGKKAAIKAGS